ncbi:MAG TPA: c-type cytochrome [Candidatus Obscuribacterales bacterium]
MKTAFCVLVILGAFSVPSVHAAGDAHRGEEIFAANCSMCHPHGGNVLAPTKELKGEAFLQHFPKDQMITAVIRAGVPKSVMSPFPKERLSDEQVSDVVAYIRTLTPAPGKTDQQTPACKPAGKRTSTAAGRSASAKGNHRPPQR